MRTIRSSANTDPILLKSSLLIKNSSQKDRDLYGDPIIFRTQDEWGDIMVIDRDNCRVLTFDPIYEQSSMDHTRPHLLVFEYTRAMMIVAAFTQPRHITLLGLGGGSLLRSLFHILPVCKFHVIELRQQVYETAKKYFKLPSVKNIKVSITDAMHALPYVKDSSTNIIFSDMYDAYVVNRFQMRLTFITESYRILSDPGWLVINYHEMPEVSSRYFQQLLDIFGSIFVCKTSAKQYILFACTRRVDTIDIFKDAIKKLELILQCSLIQFLDDYIKLK